ncbi:MAG: effector binding domain-containing protein [Prevotellaceae bacterium]|jgi:predicted transcriptional regulator YdeE|nr:effector binding domain-containing protein [Prevotellaceae bacterium]
MNNTKTSYKTIELDEFYIVGISVRTINRNGSAQQDIAGLWARFMGQNLIAEIPNKLGNEIYCMYTDYEHDYTGMYTTILGCKVGAVDNVPDGFMAKYIPSGKYRVYKAVGQIPASVGSVWNEIWQSEADDKTKINRRYLADFDVYGENSQAPQQPEVDIFLSINE